MIRRRSAEDGQARLDAAARLARVGGGIALEHWSRAQVSYGEPIALLAGDPMAHDETLREVLEVGG